MVVPTFNLRDRYMNMTLLAISLPIRFLKTLSGFLTVLALVLIIPAISAIGQEIREERAKFDVLLFGVRVGHLEIASRNNGRQYAVTSLLDSRGVARLFIPSSYMVRTRGHVRQGRLIPSRYIEERNTEGKLLTKTVHFRDGKLDRIEYDPPKSGQQDQAANSGSGGSNDLLTTMYSIARDRRKNDLCNSRIVTFNGNNWSVIETDRPEFNNQAIATCHALIYSTHDPTSDHASGKQYDVEFTYGPHTSDDGWYMLLQISAQTRAGKLIVRRKS